MHNVLYRNEPALLSGADLIQPLEGHRMGASFSWSARVFAVKRVDLTQELAAYPQAAFLLRVGGDSMRDVGNFDVDTLMVDKALKPRHEDIVVAVGDGELMVKQLCQRAGRVKLRAAAPTFPDITAKDGHCIQMWGLVTSRIKRFPV